jgi:hypothetical protein
MHASTTCQIVFTASSDKLEMAMDYLEKLQRGEYFMDEDNESLVLVIEEDLYLTCKEDIIRFVEKLYRKLKTNVAIHALGTFNAMDYDSHREFECQYNKNCFRYRETEWGSDLKVDEDLSYEEFEEESNIDMDEDEYEEYVHRAHEGIKDNNKDSFGDWEYID